MPKANNVVDGVRPPMRTSLPAGHVRIQEECDRVKDVNRVGWMKTIAAEGIARDANTL